MARAALSGSELVTDLSAWLAKIMARLTGSSAPSRAVCNTNSRTLPTVLADEKSHFYMYLEIIKTLADNTVCVLSGELPRHFQQY
jgi:hypothetical protein